MEIIHYESYEALSQRAKTMIREHLLQQPDLLLCAATGGSPSLTYALLRQDAKEHPKLFAQMRLIKLDEWGGLPMQHPASCESYLQEQLIQPLTIDCNRYIAFQSDAVEPADECARIRQELIKKGPIDLCILGLGINGHIAFNEPANSLQASCHVAKLSKESQGHAMVTQLVAKPPYGYTLGMADIMLARQIILLITGSNKTKVTQTLLSGKITSQLPASFLWLHPHVLCLIDQGSVSV